MKTILAAIDFSTGSDAVLRKAIEFARAFQARLIILHVFQPPAFPSKPDQFTGHQAERTAAAELAADARLRQVGDDLRQEHSSVETKLLAGEPVAVILATATTQSADLVILGSHGHEAMYDLLIGSTTSGVLKRAVCPVIIVPSSKAAEQRR